MQGSNFSKSADARIDGKTLPLTIARPTLASLKLPDFDTIDLAPGIKSVEIINSDGEVSNAMTFELETVVVVKVKAWRVLDEDDDGTGRDDDDIREIFNHEFAPASIWDDHGIRLEFDDNVGVARVSSDLADTWPASSDSNSDSAAMDLVTPTANGDRYFMPGAINFYVVNGIDDTTAHAYTKVGLAEFVNPPPWVIFEDTGWLSVEGEAHVAAHEIGHVLGLHHVCAKNDDEDASTTDFGRVCSENGDKDRLMFPKTNRWTNEGNALRASEVLRAKRFARNLHRAAP